MALARRAFVIGGHTTPFIGKHHPDFIWKRHPDFGKRDNPTLEQTITAAVNGALEATGTPAEAVDKAWIGNFVGELFSNQGHLGAAVVGANEGLLYKPVMRVEGACASGGLAFACALDAIAGGSDVALVVGAEVQTTASARTGGDYLARASHYARQRALDDFTFPALFAARVKACREAYGLSDDDLAHASVKAYSNANKNPLAHMKNVHMDFETARSAGERNPAFLSNEDLQPFMKISDCSQVSDGGSALVLVSEEGLKKLGKTESDAIEVLALAQTTGNLYVDEDPTRLSTTAVAAKRAYEQAGLTPADMDVGEVHDCFTVTELLMMEALGFADHTQGAKLIADGRTALDGDIPINTGGGLVGFGHPVGATGVKQILEIYRQMKGQCGDYQIAKQATHGITANMGGNDKSVVCGIYRNL